MATTDPIRPTDDQARALAQGLIAGAAHAALAVTEAGTGHPLVSRIALGQARDGTPISLVSSLAAHTTALRANPACSLLLGEPGPRGDPLTHPRLTLMATAQFVAPDDDARPTLRADYLASHPKAKLYADFADFAFVLFEVERAFLNGGFGQAFRLTPSDLRP
jgi:putative heme iron utilization protein